jgi:ABC-type ATPase with predicted acetyltransferase domain
LRANSLFCCLFSWVLECASGFELKVCSDFKEKVRQYSDKEKTAIAPYYSPEVLDKLKQKGIDPNNVKLEQLFPEAYIKEFEYSHKCVWEDFPEGLETSEITKMLWSVGFASPPDWLKSYDCLSQGEKMRGDIARALCLEQSLVVFDEFTSVVDREIAKVSAFAMSKAVRRNKKQFIAVTCYYDVVDWLDPDWVFCTDTMEFSRKKEVGRPLTSAFIGAAQVYGRCFGHIII